MIDIPLNRIMLAEVDMKSSFKKMASDAKSRLKSGYWEELYKNRDEDIRLALEHGVGEDFIRDVYKSKNTRAKRELVWGMLYPKVKDIIERELSGETILNPIGILINKAVFDCLDGAMKERYVLELSKVYLELRKEIERDIKLKSLKAKTLD